MTNWLPDLAGLSGPLYQRLAERIERDIGDGVLAQGTKLPPQRDLAFDIGTTVGTVGRAYSLLRERGLVSGEVGRGTYILARKPTLAVAPRDAAMFAEAKSGVSRFDIFTAADVGQGDVIGAVVAEICRDMPGQIATYSPPSAQWLEAGCRWLSRGSFQPTPDMIVPTVNSSAAANGIILACTKPGDLILFEEMAMPLKARAAAEMGRRIDVVAMDENGITPESLKAACAQKHPRVLVLTPFGHMPTAASVPADRRQAIAEIAREYNLLVIEDEMFVGLADKSLPRIAEFAPERTFVIGGLSLSVSAGIRGCWTACPPAYRNRVRLAAKLIAGALPFLISETAARLVLTGAAERIVARTAARHNDVLALAKHKLAPFQFDSAPNVAALWLNLPGTWNSSPFKQAAMQHGLVIDDEDEFKIMRSEKVFHRVWMGLSGPLTQTELEDGLSEIHRLLEAGPAGGYERPE